MLKPREALLVALCCAWVTSLSGDTFPNNPKLAGEGGHLVISTAQGKNISFRTGSGRGGILFNGEDVAAMLDTVKNAHARLAPILGTDQMGALSNIIPTVQSLQSQVLDLTNSTNVLRSEVSNIKGRRLRMLQRSVVNLRTRVTVLETDLRRDECASNPCQHGGTCIDLFKKYQCLCRDNWEGAQCEQDVDECSRYAYSDLGCQNGGTCINTPGGYRCQCPAAYHGVHCTEQHDDCASSSSQALCGHGTCISRKNQSGQVGYSCICDQGWTKRSSGDDPACTEDVDECSTGRHFCSRQPPVQCINYPGGFTCGPCPAGYSGDGFTCVDIDECLVNNGGCSTNPRVDCINTVGSRTCGPCPPGYAGDGVRCSYVGLCYNNNGGCSVNAICIEHSGTFRECRCQAGFVGHGVGPAGCLPAPNNTGVMQPVGPSLRDPCTPNPCQHGFCLPTSTPTGQSTFHCSCSSGYSGPLCDAILDSCNSSPCENNGTCVNRADGYQCTCTAEWTGTNCEHPRQDCGGSLRGSNGTLMYPLTADTYAHRRHCVWHIHTTLGKVLNITFTKFSLEEGHECAFDFLEIHDGETMSSPLVGRYCGTTMTGKNLTSTHPVITVWFKTDHSVAGEGFALNWTAVDPVCGKALDEADVGSVQSPGYPGNYPSTRDCFWTVRVPVGKRIQFHFATLQLEHHENCNYDFLKIYDGASENDQLLGSYCSTGIPSPVMTAGHLALLHFHSDDSQTDSGFHVTYASVPGVPGCGGLLSGTKGRFTSPNYPESYNHNIVCEWEIRVPLNERVELRFEDFELESGRSCRWDYVEIFDGPDDSSELKGRFCGSTGPQHIKSSGSRMFVRFKSDGSNAHRGFNAVYIAACGGRYTDLNGTLTSPGYPNEYQGNRNCNYSIEVPLNNVIQLTFQMLDIEESGHCQFDYVKVWEPSTNGTNEIAKLCGRTPPDPITSTLNHLYLVFHSDHSVHRQGFYANYTTIPTDCGGVLTTAGTLQSPATQQGQYPHNSRCSWILRAPPGFVVRLTFTGFILESSGDCKYDYVQVADSSGHTIGRYCGTQIPPALISTGETLFVNFQTDASVAHDGFLSTFDFVNASSICGRDYYLSEGVIRSPGFPGSYPSRRDCSWIIHAPEGQQIRLNFTTFDLEGPPCRYDYLEIRNGGDPTAPIAGQYCAREPPQGFISYTNVLRLRFVSDDSTSGAGFEVSYDTALTGCGGVASGTSGHITSPNYPQPYGHNADCSWTIKVSQGSVISIVIVDVDIEQHAACNYDFLELYDGPSMASPRLARLCNTPQMAIHYQSTDSTVFLRFRTDSSAAGRGFHITYTAECNNVIRNKRRGVIESPNFPNSYAHNYNCTWTIRAPMGHNVSMAFSHFHLETHPNCNFDYLEVNESTTAEHDGPPRGNRNLARLCGDRLPSIITSTSNVVRVRFITDDSNSMEGFRLEYAWQGCGGELRKPSGAIQTPNYPNGYPRNTECIWNIQVAPGAKVELTIRNFHMESSHGCVFDFVRVYGGPDVTSPLITELCEFGSVSQVLTSNGNTMTVHFRSDSSISGQGFYANYATRQRGCGGTFITTSTTFITSSNYPANYDAHDDCVWTLKTTKGHVVMLNFLDFDVPQSTNCSQSFLWVYDWVSTRAFPVLKHCGGNLPEPPLIRSTGNRLTIWLKGDGSSAGRGFKANFTQGCGATVNVDVPGAISSFNYPHYSTSPLGSSCSWLLITNVTGEKVSLTITHIEKSMRGCFSSNVTIRNGPSPDSPILDTLCSRSIPPTFTSTGSALYVQSYTAVFRAVYSAFTASCGGTLEGDHGYFASAGHPYSYHPSQDCVWTIKASEGNFFQLSVLQLDIEASEYCGKDYLEIRETNSDGPLLGRFCGSDPPANLTQAAGFWIKFRSDEEGTGAGFKLEFSLVREVSLEKESGQIESPGYPKLTWIHGRITWTIRVPPGLFPRITFDTSYIMTDNCDVASLQIFDGGDTEALSVGRYCGSEDIEPLRLRTSLAVIRYESTLSNARFKLRWQAVNDTYFPGTTHETAGSLCSRNVLLHNATEKANITSRGYPRTYEENVNCTWIIMAPPKRRVSLKIDAMSLRSDEAAEWNCYYDTLKVFDVTSWTNGPQRKLVESCGVPSTLPPPVSGSGQTLRVTFVTGPTYYHTRGTGFTATVSSVCGGNVTDTSGILEDSDILPGEVDCQWLISPGRRRKLKLTLESYNIPSSDGVCRDNSIQILNGGYEDSPPLGQGRFCGTSSSDVALPETTSDKAFVIYRSSAGGVRFRLRWEEALAECGGRVELTTGSPQHEFHSPGYPHQGPPHSTECYWLLQAPPGKRIVVDFPRELHMRQGCNEGAMTDFVRVLDGGTEVSPELGTFCGEQRAGAITSSGNLVLVQFVQTGSGDNYAGFTATARIGECGGTVWGGSIPELIQKLRSGAAFDCEWQLIGAVNSSGVRFVVSYLTLPESPGCSGDDYLEVRDGNATGPVLSRICGANQSIDVSPTDNKLFVHVKTRGAPPQSRAFRLHLSFVGRACGGTLEATEGDFQTPGFPAPMPVRTNCRWVLNAPTGRRITVSFLEGDISNCDSTLTLTDGILVLPVLCNTSFPYVYESFTSQLLVAMQSPRLSTVHGFRAHYDSAKELPCYQTPEEPSGMLVPTAEALQARPSMCTWRFPLKPNATLAYTVVGVNVTATNVGCKEEYFKGDDAICERGKSGRSPKRYAATELTYVKKHSQPSGGINATYKISECGGLVKVWETPSFFTSPAYPDQYTRNADCMWILDPAQWNAQVELNFTSFELENDCSKDYVDILSGSHVRSPSIDKYCGTRRPPLLRGTQFAVIFHSDGDGAAAGFNFTVSLSGLPCGGFLHIRNEITLKSPRYPSAYPANTECDWLLDGQRGHRVNITFTGRFDIQQSASCARDYIQIFNDVDGSWTSPVKYCGLNKPPTFVSTSHRARLLFRSDASLQGDGFKAVVTLACGDNYTDPMGDITSPRYPNEYEGSLNCDYLIVVPQGSHVEITFDPQFDIEQAEDCRYDSLTLYEGPSDSSRQLLHTCGKEAPGNLTVSSSVLVRFKTDWTVGGRGFALSYRVFTCGGNLTGPTGTFGIDPGVIRNECVWYISVDPGHAVEIRFLYLRGGWGTSYVQCPTWYHLEHGVLVYDGNRTASQLLYAYCGRAEQSSIAISTSNSAVVAVENRDGAGNTVGFRALYRATLGPLQGCGGTVRMGDTGRVNVRWPQTDGSQYPPDVNCVWRVLGSPGKILRVNFTEFQLQQSNDSTCTNDVVEVWDTLLSRDFSRQRFCGSTAPSSILMAGNIASLRFSSDHAVSGTGFKAVVTQEAPLCGGDLTIGATANVVSSPGFPSGAVPGTQCAWNLADEVVIHFTSFHIPCEMGASLTIVSINQEEKSKEFCGDSIPHLHQAVWIPGAGSQRTIVFNAGSAVNQSRFQFNYRRPISENRTYTSDSGIVMNYLYPEGSYLERLPLIINISPVTRGGSLSLYFLRFSLGSPHNGTCAAEAMEVREGETTNSRMLATLCGGVNPNPLFSTSDRITLVIDRNRHNVFSHFVTFSVMYITSTQGPGCGGNVTHTEGAFSSPGYPGALQEAKTCRWYIGVPGRNQMTLRFQAFSLNSTAGCDTNYVEIYEGTSDQDDGFVVRYCGQDHPAPYESRGNKIVVKLVTSGPQPGQGFYALFRANVQETPPQVEYAVGNQP
ncbi:cubilin-like [Ornithodoros turicata]|uniref:cubilin-like n=1 Tax=Ornithodoros turicata TaxID=34597 RepID=UPI0031394771